MNRIYIFRKIMSIDLLLSTMHVCSFGIHVYYTHKKNQVNTFTFMFTENVKDYTYTQYPWKQDETQ